MEKRVLLAVFLSFLVLFAYQLVVVRFFPPPNRPRTQGPTTGTPSAGPESVRGGALAQAPSRPLEPRAPAVALVADQRRREVVVETDEVRAVFDNRGARLTSYRLKRYLSDRGEPLDLVPTDLPETEPRPFQLAVDDESVNERLRAALFRPNVEYLVVGRGGATLRFEFEDTAGLKVWKELVFDGERPYVIELRARVEVAGKELRPRVHWGPGVGSGDPQQSRLYYRQGPQAIYSIGRKVSRIAPRDLQRAVQGRQSFDFVGVDDHYFLAVAVRPALPLAVRYRSVSVGGSPEARQFVAFELHPGQPQLRLRFFAGPKDFDRLAAVDRDLVRAIHFGWFAWLVVPLLRSLKWINGYIGNYGWSIIVLTVLINAAMFPLRHRSVVAMRRLQEIQPEIKAIQDRYAKLKLTDPARRKMNEELMALYRERGVNPASGCLPMLLTLPVLFAFYSMLSVAVELRGAPFIWWIRDLSRHDPLYITPLLMGATMVWQQKLTPTSADPTQQKVMMVMPIVFTVMFLWAPSGLVLYWFVSNLWAIGQQVITNRLIGPPRVRIPRPPAERRLRRVPVPGESRARV